MSGAAHIFGWKGDQLFARATTDDDFDLRVCRMLDGQSCAWLVYRASTMTRLSWGVVSSPNVKEAKRWAEDFVVTRRAARRRMRVIRIEEDRRTAAMLRRRPRT